MIRCRLYYRPGHPKANAHGFVDTQDLDEAPPVPTHVPVVTDLFMDGHVTVDGEDIGSRRKRKDYMARTGSLDATDFSHGYFERKRESAERREEEATKRSVIDSFKRLRKV